MSVGQGVDRSEMQMASTGRFVAARVDMQISNKQRVHLFGSHNDGATLEPDCGPCITLNYVQKTCALF